MNPAQMPRRRAHTSKWARATGCRTRRRRWPQRQDRAHRAARRGRSDGDRGHGLRFAQVVPQMADNAQVMAGIRRRPGVAYPVLVPNLQGFEAARRPAPRKSPCSAPPPRRSAAGTSIAPSKKAWPDSCRLPTRQRREASACAATVSCVSAAPIRASDARGGRRGGGEAPRDGCYEISLGDTIGVGTPGKLQAMLRAVAERVPMARLAVHCHDTYARRWRTSTPRSNSAWRWWTARWPGWAAAPTPRGASGNVATEDVVYLLDGLGIATGVDLDRLAAAGRYICGELGARPPRRSPGARGKGGGMKAAAAPAPIEDGVASPCINVCR